MTSMGWLTTPTTERISDMKSRGNQMMAMRKVMIRPPIPYLTIFFFFCPLGWGYFYKGDTGYLPSPLPQALSLNLASPNRPENLKWPSVGPPGTLAACHKEKGACFLHSCGQGHWSRELGVTTVDMAGRLGNTRSEQEKEDYFKY